MLPRTIRYTAIFFLLLLFLGRCDSRKQSYVSKPTRSLANPESDLLDVAVVIYHSQDSVSDLFLKINNSNLLYRRPDTSKAFYAELKVSFRVMGDKNGKKVISSDSVIISDRGPDDGIVSKDLFHAFKIKVMRPNNYSLEIDVLDINRRTRYSKQVNINKSNEWGPQNFLVLKNDSVAFGNEFKKNEHLRIRFPRDVSFIRVESFSKEFGPALPPFSTRAPDELKYKPDSTFTILVQNREFYVTMPEKGFYHLKADPDKLEGRTLYTVDETFPGVGTSLEMIQCTRYIMFKEEYEKCRDAADKKVAIDEFWLGIGGSNERAKELLRRYYGRVKEANKLFTSYTQGWKSDRGMIHIVMGPPPNIYRNKKNEVWVYGNDANPNALRFVFNKTENPFSDNDYIMERSVLYKDSYHTAVEYWRQGMVYYDNGKK